MLSLSHHKANFLKEKFYAELDFTLENAYHIAQKYQEKHGITIYVKNHLKNQGIRIIPFQPPHIDTDDAASQTSLASDESEDTYEYDPHTDIKATIEAITDILSIQNTLTNDQYVGYLYTSSPKEAGHFECFIIGKNRIIKPISWLLDFDLGSLYGNGNVLAEQLLKAPSYHYSFTDLLDFSNKEEIPQADSSSCGSLSLSYLKNLLKHNASQLHQFCLSVPYFNTKNELMHFFVPSPHVLRYSQCSTYNEFIKDLIESESAENSLQNRLIATIEKSKELKQSESISQAYHDSILSEVHDCLRTLNEFRNRWLGEYNVMITKRTLMQDGYNRYLTYTAHRLTIQARLVQQQARNHETLKSILTPLNALSFDEATSYLEKELPNIQFINTDHVAYLLYLMPDKLRTTCFLTLKDKTLTLRTFCQTILFLTNHQKKQLREDIRNFQHLHMLILDPIYNVFEWLDLLHFSAEEKSHFVGLHITLDRIHKKLPSMNAYESYKLIKNYCDLLNNPSFIIHILTSNTLNQIANSRQNNLPQLLKYLHNEFPETILTEIIQKQLSLFIQKVNLSKHYHAYKKEIALILRSAPENERRNCVVNTLNHISFNERFTFLESIYPETIDELIDKYDLYSLLHDNSQWDLDISITPKTTHGLTRKRPFGDLMDFEMFFFSLKKSLATHSNQTQPTSEQNHSHCKLSNITF